MGYRRKVLLCEVLTSVNFQCPVSFHFYLAVYHLLGPTMCPSNDGVEDTEHFLLYCHSYDAYRIDLVDTVNSTLQPYGFPNLSNALFLEIILYGDKRFSFDSNAKILKATL